MHITGILKRILSAVIALLIFAAVPAAAQASYGVLTENELNDRVKLGSRTVYDRSSGLFLYQAGRAEVGMNIPSGSVTNAPVKVTVPDGMSVRVYRDGAMLQQADLQNLNEPGAYSVRFGETNDSVDFTIVDTHSADLVRLDMPEGFSVVKVLLDGSEVANTGSYVDMNQEGTYVVDYGCEPIGIYYRLQVTVDHSTPTLTFTNLENGKATGPVDIEGIEDGITVTIIRDGEEQEFATHLTHSGSYVVTASNAAGSSTEYRFTIGLYYTLNLLSFLLILAAAAGGLIAYMVLSRRRLRIR